jgi:ribosomal-protein-alanine N-acetyltransferase
MHSSDEKINASAAARVRRMSASDIPAAISILAESPEAATWSSASLSDSASHGLAWTAELHGGVAGILIGLVAADEFEVLNLAVGEACRRRGVATQLVRAALEYSRSSGARQAYLEVRVSNEGGIAFYKRMGFRACGRRRNYYSNPVEDAVQLVLHNFGTTP